MNKTMMIIGVIIFILGGFYILYTQDISLTLWLGDKETRDGLISLTLLVVGVSLILFGMMPSAKEMNRI